MGARALSRREEELLLLRKDFYREEKRVNTSQNNPITLQSLDSDEELKAVDL